MITSRRVARLATVAIGIWLMAAPAVLSFGGTAENAHRLLGPIAGSLAFVAVWPFVDQVKWATVPVGALLAVSPVLGFPAPATVNAIGCGLAIVALAFTGGRPEGNFGGGWRVLWQGRVRRTAEVTTRDG